MATILNAATANGAGSQATITGGTTLILTGTIGPTAVVNVRIAAPSTTDFAPFVTLNNQQRTAVVPLGRSDAEALINADLSGVVAGDGTSVTLRAL